MRILLPAFACLTLGACVSLDASECQGANWYEIGFRDGLFGMSRMDVAYEDQCGKHGARTDVVAYAKGWQEGLWEFEARKGRSGLE